MPDALGVTTRWEVRSYLGINCFVRYRGPWDLTPAETSRIVEPLLARAALSAAVDAMDAHELESMSSTLIRERPWHPGRARSKAELLSGLLEAIDTGELVVLQVDPPRPPTIIPQEEPDLPAPRTPSRVQRDPPLDFIEVILVDEDGAPVGYVPYELKLPDGQVIAGETDFQGKCWTPRTPSGSCQLTFPNLDQAAWAPA